MQDFRVFRDGISLAATYSPGGDTALVALHGAGHGTRDFLLYRHLHEVLPRAGIGVVSFDRRGEGESTGDASRGRFQLQVDDALAVREAIDVERVGMWGFSQGGWIAPLAASQSDARRLRRRRRLHGSDAVGADDVCDGALSSGWPATGTTWSTGRSICGAASRIPSTTVRWTRRRCARDLLAALDEDWFRHLWLPPTTLDEEGKRLWIEEMDFDPEPIFAGVRRPGPPLPRRARQLVTGARERGDLAASETGRRGRRHPRGRARHDARGRDDRSRVRAAPRRLAASALALGQRRVAGEQRLRHALELAPSRRRASSACSREGCGGL